jgi:DNA-binding transcriptional LysR family regulator
MVTSSGVDSARASLGSIDLNLLVALDALLRDRSVTRAGRRIGLSQPAMSHALARLREMLGDPVLTREGRAMRRTALGERLAPPGVVDFALAERKMERRVRVRVPSFLVAPLVVAQTDLILTAPERIARIAARAHRLRILAPPLALPSFSVQLVRRAGSDDAALRWLRGRIVEAAALIASAAAPVTR